MGQQPALDLHIASCSLTRIASKPLGTNHPMTGHNHRQGVAPTGVTHRPWTAAQLAGHIPIGPHLTQRNRLQQPPDRLLKFRTRGVQGQRKTMGSFQEVAVELLNHSIHQRRIRRFGTLRWRQEIDTGNTHAISGHTQGTDGRCQYGLPCC